MSMLKEFEGSKIVLLVMASKEYNKSIVEVVKALDKGSVCYVTLNKTFDSLQELFKKKKVNLDNIVFIDAISKSIKKAPAQSKNVYYVSSPGALTELSLVISKFLRHKFDYLIFDSITNLMTYQDSNIVSRFISSLTNKIKSGNTQTVFYALDIKEHESVIKKCQMVVDKVISEDSNGKN